MAADAITAINLALNTPSADTPDADNNVTVAADGWEIAPATGRSLADGKLLIRIAADASGDTFTFVAGDRPPSPRADIGNMTVVLAASDVKFIAVDMGRFLHDDGKVRVTCTDADSTLAAFHLPREY